MLWVSLTCSTTFMIETIRPVGRKYLNQWVWNEWKHQKLPVKRNPSSSDCFSNILSLKADGQLINEVVKCPEYCALTIWHVLLSIFTRILNWIEPSLWTISSLRPTFTVTGDFQMQWSDGQKLGKFHLSAISSVSSWYASFCSYGRIESVPTLFLPWPSGGSVVQCSASISL